MSENKLLIEPIDTPQLSNQNLTVDFFLVLSLFSSSMFFGKDINFFLIRGEIENLGSASMMPSSPVNFNDN
jgi:hypothetical protein